MGVVQDEGSLVVLLVWMVLLMMHVHLHGPEFAVCVVHGRMSAQAQSEVHAGPVHSMSGWFVMSKCCPKRRGHTTTALDSEGNILAAHVRVLLSTMMEAAGLPCLFVILHPWHIVFIHACIHFNLLCLGFSMQDGAGVVLHRPGA